MGNAATIVSISYTKDVDPRFMGQLCTPRSTRPYYCTMYSVHTNTGLKVFFKSGDNIHNVDGSINNVATAYAHKHKMQFSAGQKIDITTTDITTTDNTTSAPTTSAPTKPYEEEYPSL